MGLGAGRPSGQRNAAPPVFADRTLRATSGRCGTRPTAHKAVAHDRGKRLSIRHPHFSFAPAMGALWQKLEWPLREIRTRERTFPYRLMAARTLLSKNRVQVTRRMVVVAVSRYPQPRLHSRRGRQLAERLSPVSRSPRMSLMAQRTEFR